MTLDKAYVSYMSQNALRLRVALL